MINHRLIIRLSNVRETRLMTKTQALIYKIENVFDGKVYIGSTRNFKNRWKAHLSNLRTNKHHSRHLQFAWNKYGESAFYVSVIEYCNNDTRVQKEQKWMDHYLSYNKDCGYNICPKAESVTGKAHTAETREKISKSHKGKVKSEAHRRSISESQKGKTYSDEYKKKMSEATKGRVVTKETIAKILAAKSGYKHSDLTRQKIREMAIGRKPSKETRDKISAAGIGRKWTEEQRQKIMSRPKYKFNGNNRKKISESRGGRSFIVIDSNGVAYKFFTLGEVRDSLGLDPSNVHKCLIGKAKQTKGYRCEYEHP